MRFAAFEGESRFSELVDRLFDLPTKRASPLRKAAEQALRDANPQLADLRTLPRGTPILVPDVPGVPPTRETSSAATPWDDLVRGLAKTLEVAQESIETSLRQDTEEHERTNVVLKSREVREHARQDEALNEQIARIATSTGERLEASRIRFEQRTRGLAALKKDLDDFTG